MAGTAITGEADLRRALRNSRPNTTVKLAGVRGAGRFDIDLTLGEFRYR
jgi:S1-C subfamily serine protease